MRKIQVTQNNKENANRRQILVFKRKDKALQMK